MKLSERVAQPRFMENVQRLMTLLEDEACTYGVRLSVEPRRIPHRLRNRHGALETHRNRVRRVRAALSEMQRKERIGPPDRIASCVKHLPSFDSEAARELPPAEIRRRWPRFWGECECGFRGIAYASFLHYIAGDW